MAKNIGRMAITVGDMGDTADLLKPIKNVLIEVGDRAKVYADPAGKGKDLLKKENVPFTEANSVDDWDGVSVLVCGTSGKAQTLHFNAMREAKKRGITIVGVEDLYGTSLKATPEQAPYDHLVVMDERAAEIDRRVRKDIPHIHPLGNSTYDDIPTLVAERDKRRDDFRTPRGIAPDYKVVVYWGSSMKQIDVKETLDAMLAVFSGMGRIVFVPQFHPADPEEDRKRWLGYIDEGFDKSAGKILHLGKVVPDDISLVADLVVTDYSTNGVRSFLMGIPTIFAVLPSSQRYLENEKQLVRPYFPQMNEDIGTVAYSDNILVALLRIHLYSFASLRKFSRSITEVNHRDFSSLTSGRATATITEFLLSFILE